MDLKLNGIKVSVSEPEIAAIVRRHLLAQESPVPRANASLPAIGEEFEGGIYAGLTLHEGQPHRLVLLPEDHEPLQWKAAIAWAKAQGGELPSRMDCLVLWENVKAQFQSTWYWSCEQHAGDESYAWFQYFDYGGQGYNSEYDKLRARAVRRIPIQ